MGQYYCNSCNLYVNISDKSSHLISDEHKNKNKKYGVKNVVNI